MEAYVLGLDGGGTKTLAQAMDAQGAPLFCVRGGALNANSEAYRRVRDTVQELLAQAAVCAGPDRYLAAVCIAAAGTGNPDACRVLRSALADAGFRGPARVVGDHLAALTGALGSPEGMVLIAGTGSICAGRTADGREARAGGRGHLIDDEGSGYAMGRDVLRAVVEAEDGRGPCTCLTPAVYKALQVTDVAGLVSYVYAPGRSKREIACLARLLPQAAARDDRAAQRIYMRAAEELARLVQAVAERLAMQNGSLALAGGALYNDAHLRELLEARLNRLLPELHVVQARHDAAWGAAQMARGLLSSNREELR